MAAHHLGTAIGDILNGLPMRGGHTPAEPVPVGRPVGPENIRYARHDCLKISQKAIERCGEGLETLIGQVGIDSGGLRTFMSQQFLNHSQIHSSFE